MKKTKLLLSLTSLTTIGLASSTLASCGCSTKEESKITSINVSLKEKEYFTVGEQLKADYLKVTAVKEDKTTETLSYNSDGVNGYKLDNFKMGDKFDDSDFKENFELKVSYKEFSSSVKFNVCANVDDDHIYKEHVQSFELNPVVKGNDLVATFVPEENYIVDESNTGIEVGSDIYTLKDNPDIVKIEYSDNSSFQQILRVSGSVINSSNIYLSVYCKEPEVKVTGVNLDKPMIEFISGSTEGIDVTATVTPETATLQRVRWTVTKGTDLISIKSSGTDNKNCKVTPIGPTGTAEVTCTSESNPSISTTCQVIIRDQTIKLTGEHNFDIANDSLQITATTQSISQLYWSVSDSSLVTLQNESTTGVKVIPTENAKKYGGYVYVYAKDAQQNIQASYPISFGSYSLLEKESLANGVAKWCGKEQTENVQLVIPSWYILEDSSGNLSGKEITSYVSSTTNVDKITFIFLPYSIHSIPSGAFGSWTSLTEIIIDYDNKTYTSGGNKDTSLNKRFNAVINKSTKTVIAGCKGSTLENSDDETVSTIGSLAFDNTGITSFNIPTNINVIEKNAFSNCSTLTSVTYTGSESHWTKSNDDHSTCEALFLSSTATEAAEELKYNATYTLNNLNYVKFKETIEESGEKYYEVYCEEADVTKMKGKLVIPAKYNNIDVCGIYYNESTDAGGFEGAENIESIYIPKTITYISDYAFRNCTGLTECVAEELVGIDRGAFHYVGNIKIDIKKNNLVGIGYGAFAESGLHEFTIPACCMEIGQGAFLSSMLKRVTIEKPTTSSYDWKVVFKGEYLSVDKYCTSKGLGSIYTSSKLAAQMLRFGYIEGSESGGFADYEWKTNLY